MPIRLISLAILSFFLTSEYIYSDENKFLLPQPKPSVFKKTKKQINTIIPLKKPGQIKESKAIAEEKKPDTEKKVESKTLKKEELKREKKISFLLPKKKPKSYKIVNAVEKSRILSQKDFEKSKSIFANIKAGKWNTAHKQSAKLKDKDFKEFINWLYLLKTGNNATFSDYQSFIKTNPDYPRIGRLRYLDEQKIYLKNNTANNVISWFDSYPPVSGTGKLKLAEALFSIKKDDNLTNLIKEGWIDASLNKSQLRFYRNKFKRILRLI